MQLKGQIVYVPLEGGFWGIEGEDGRQYLPVEGLPEALQENGLKIEAEIEPADVVTTRMWGRTIRVLRIIRA